MGRKMWITLILNNIRTIGIIAAILAVFGVGMWVESQIAENTLKRELAKQQAALVAQCDADKKLTEGIDNEQLQKITALSKQLNNSKRVFAAKCNVPLSASTSIDNAATRGGKPIGQNGVSAEALLELAADGEKYRITLISCQDFIKKAIVK